MNQSYTGYTATYNPEYAKFIAGQSVQTPQVQQPQVQPAAVQQPQVQSAGTQTTLGNVATPKYDNVSAGNIDPKLSGASDRYYNALADSAEYNTQRLKSYNESIIGQASPYIKAGVGIVNAASSLASIYTGLQQLKLARKAEARADEMWREQLKELNHVRSVRKRISAGYGGY